MNNGESKGTGASTIAALKSSPGIQALYQLYRTSARPVQ